MSRRAYGRVAVLLDPVAEKAAGATEPEAPAQSTIPIIEALDALGYEPEVLPLQADVPHEWIERLRSGEFRVAFNLCESVRGSPAAEHLAAAAVELLDLPMTGACSATLLHCLNKDRVAAVLRAHGFAVPDWKLVRRDDPVPTDWDRFPAIVKPAAQDGSNGIHANSVARSPSELADAVERLREKWGSLVIQQFVEGREINLAIVGNQLLPPAEIDFSDLPDDVPPIVSFTAKWVSGSPEDLGTRPICPAPLPAEQAEELQRLAARVWTLMEGSGYGRVDVRLSADGTPYIIDVNPNADLSRDAGLARQAWVAGWSYEELIGKIVEEALARHDGSSSASTGWFILPAVRGVGGST
ncbi:MAG: D-alanine--D-alanine ligase [Gemmatimonadota bacterium]|nr:MAG: D-alanine--D-alanine ligase [Gemmatimonadota bacterium]